MGKGVTEAELVLDVALRLEKLLGGRHGIELTPIELRKDMRGERREKLRETERKQPPVTLRLLKQVKGKATDVRTRRSQDDDQICVVAVVPNLPETSLIGISKCDVVLEWHDLESALADTVNDTLFRQQLVWVRHDGQTRDTGDVAAELRQNGLAPCAAEQRGAHALAPITHHRDACSRRRSTSAASRPPAGRSPAASLRR